jgi:hypothetical protein
MTSVERVHYFLQEPLVAGEDKKLLGDDAHRDVL